jgi:hypothetical protein
MNPSFARADAALLDPPGFGPPEDRLARIAARRAFVELKTSFMRAASDACGPSGELLRRKVRDADESLQLWRLRVALLAALPSGHERTALHRSELLHQLDSVFPDSGPETGFVPL